MLRTSWLKDPPNHLSDKSLLLGAKEHSRETDQQKGVTEAPSVSSFSICLKRFFLVREKSWNWKILA